MNCKHAYFIYKITMLRRNKIITSIHVSSTHLGSMAPLNKPQETH